MTNKKNNITNFKKTWKSWFYILPSFSGTVVFVFFPFLDMARRSFFTTTGNKFAGLQNYMVIWHNQAFRLALKNTFLFIIIGVPLLMIVSFLIALLIQSFGKKAKLYKTTIVLPMAIPVASVCLLWKMFFMEDGILNEIILSFCNIIDCFIHIPAVVKINWIDGKTAFGILLFTFIWKNAGYHMLLWLAGLDCIPDSVYEAAKLDGANKPAIIRYIILPELHGTAGVVFILSIISSFRIYREAYLIAGSYPHESIYMLQHLFNHWFLNMDVQNMSTAATIISAGTFPCILLCFLFSRTGQRRQS